VLYLNLQKPKFFCQVIPVGTPNTELSVCSCSSCRAIEFSMQLYFRCISYKSAGPVSSIYMKVYCLYEIKKGCLKLL
jgi:hypothetical protein